MKLNEVQDNEIFYIEQIDGNETELENIATLGIHPDMEITVLRDGYLKGSKIILVNNTQVQIAKRFVNMISGNVIKNKEMIKKIKR